MAEDPKKPVQAPDSEYETMLALGDAGALSESLSGKSNVVDIRGRLTENMAGTNQDPDGELQEELEGGLLFPVTGDMLEESGATRVAEVLDKIVKEKRGAER